MISVNLLLIQFFTISGSRLLRIPIAMVSITLLSRVIGPEGVGNWSLIIAVAVFFNSVFFSWMQSQAVRKGREEWLNSNKLANTWAARQPLILFGLVFTVLIFWWQPFSFFEKITHLPELFGWLSLAYLVGILWLSEAQIIQQTTGKISHYALIPLLIDTFIVIFLMIILYLEFEANSIQIISGIVILMTVCGCLIWWSEFISSHSWGGVTSNGVVGQLIIFGGPVAFSALMGFSSDWCDHFLLQYFHGAKEVGFFQSGYQVMLAMMAMGSPIAVIFLPKLIDKLKQDPKAEADYIQRVTPMVSLLWLLLIIPCITAMPWIFSFVFGTKFQDAQLTMLILCIAVPGSIFTYLYTILFNIQGRSIPPALFLGAMALTNLAISIALVPSMGSLGAAIGTAVSYLLVQMLYILNQHRYILVSSIAPISLFSVGLFFGVVQVFLGEEPAWRLILATLCMVVLILLGRELGTLEAKTFSNMLPKEVAWLGGLFDFLLTKNKHDRN